MYAVLISIVCANVTGLSPAAALTVSHIGELGGDGGPVSVHGGSVGAARQLAGGSMCWVSGSDARQRTDTSPGT